MEFLDEYESRPRFLYQSKSLSKPSESDHDPLPSLHKPTLLVCISSSLVILALAFTYFNSEPLKSLFLWISLSLLIGPFAPPSFTAGDIRVGLGPPIEEIPDAPIEIIEKFTRKSAKSRKKPTEDGEGAWEKSTDTDQSPVSFPENESNRSNVSLTGKKSEAKYEGESGWSEADEELLRKLMGKHPVGKPGRWDAIAEGFKGKHKVQTVITKAKEMGEKKVSDQDSFKKFLKDRKPVDKRVIEEVGNEVNAEIGSVEGGKNESGWSDTEDLALLSALKAFPKDVAMRWEKISASVPGKTKAACMKRVTELKKDFRSAKASSGQAS